ncbi:hypothetical protein [Shewanella yunxiaonensis]|uniref:hypothetical protein n=1 Tax=Shewanella yunxiaonensis TaxID=2829809 RepID=UPI001E62BD0F|nr:hypothetical protein [Shewanella yunxiaonensis]
MKKGMPVLLLAMIAPLQAAELSQVGAKVAEKADKIQQQTESIELQKARAAAAETSAREQAVLSQQQKEPWEQIERAKAQQQFSERGQREAKYLQEAKEAAAKEHKMDTPKMKLIKQKSVED